MIYNEFIIRQPSFPLEFFTDINNQSSTSQQHLIDAIKYALSNARFKRALFFASSDLYELIPKFLSGKMNDKETLKYCTTIYKYVSRTSSRPTPFGAFAGVDLGKLGKQSAIEFYSDSAHKLKVRLDTVAENYLLNEILSQRRFLQHFTYSLNNTVYEVKDKIRFFEKRISDHKVNYVISSVPAEEHIVSMIENLPANFTKSEFHTVMASFSDCQEEIDVFFGDLLESGFILPEPQHCLTGRDLLIDLLDLCGLIGETAMLFSVKLEKIKNSIYNFNAGDQDQDKLALKVTNEIPDTTIRNLFQVDLDINFKRFHLKTEVLRNLTLQLKQLVSKLTSRQPNERLRAFATKFQERFGDNEVSLLVAIDPEVGISYDDSEVLASPLLDGLGLHFNDKVERTTNLLDWFKIRLAQQSIVADFKEFVLDDKVLADVSKILDLETVEAEEENFYVLGSIISKSTEELDKGNYLFDLKVIGQSSAAKLGSRFSHLKEEIKHWNIEVNKLLEGNEEDSVYAEIVHLPDYTSVNVLKRPSLSNYEIPFFASASVPVERRINVNDLYVSVRNRTVILRSKALKKIIIPKLTSAHNFTQGIPIYQFLCDLQQQEIMAGVNGRWRIPNGSVFFPRVRYRNVILNKATWRIYKDDFKGSSVEEFKNFFLAFRETYKVPKLVTLIQHDNEILIDTENWLASRIVYEEIMVHSHVLLTEFLYDKGGALINGKNGTYCNEILFQVFAKEDRKKVNPMSTVSKLEELSPRTKTNRFFPGDKWLYIKVYSGPKILDDILTNEFVDLISAIKSDRNNVRFFFIRYCDQSDHLRLRIYCEDLEYLYGQVLNHLRSIFFPLASDNAVYKIQFDTYEPEFQRYGEDIALSEKVFFADSILCIKGLSFLKENNLGEDTRVYLGVLIMKGYMDEFFSSLKDKFAFCKHMKDGYFIEYSRIPNLKPLLARKLRHYRKVFLTYESRDDFWNVRDVLLRLIAEKREYVKKIPSYGKDSELLKSYIHMSINRLFIEKQRLHELFLYDFLEKSYLSELKKSEKYQANEI